MIYSILAYQNITETPEELVEILESQEVDSNSVRYVRKTNISSKEKDKNNAGWGGKLGGLASAVHAVSVLLFYLQD